jgi:hypothetical protein
MNIQHASVMCPAGKQRRKSGQLQRPRVPGVGIKPALALKDKLGTLWLARRINYPQRVRNALRCLPLRRTRLIEFDKSCHLLKENADEADLVGVQSRSKDLPGALIRKSLTSCSS